MTTHSGHTPGQGYTSGPWQTDGSRIWHQRNPGGRKYYTAETLGNTETTIAEREANARLIAAAPLLYERAIQADQYVQHCISTGNPVNVDAMPLLHLREAIAKADGREA